VKRAMVTVGQRMEYEVLGRGVEMAENGIDVRRIAMEAADEVEGFEEQDGLGPGENGGKQEMVDEEAMVGVDDTDAPTTPTGPVGGEVERKERVYKKGPWSVPEMLALQSAKREDVVRAGKGAPREKHRTAQEKWQSIEDFCWVRLVQRSAQQCQDKWESMSAEFKKVKDFESGSLHGQKSYWLMTIDERKSVRVPPNFQKEVYSALWEWYDKNRIIEPGTPSIPAHAAFCCDLSFARVWIGSTNSKRSPCMWICQSMVDLGRLFWRHCTLPCTRRVLE
jgi:hypothetical protein